MNKDFIDFFPLNGVPIKHNCKLKLKTIFSLDFFSTGYPRSIIFISILPNSYDLGIFS